MPFKLPKISVIPVHFPSGNPLGKLVERAIENAERGGKNSAKEAKAARDDFVKDSKEAGKNYARIPNQPVRWSANVGNGWQGILTP
jgi:hypothetical protein